jgi:cytochrome c biogenesis protein CcmG/thiol:disulfide interchange protein DsbE
MSSLLLTQKRSTRRLIAWSPMIVAALAILIVVALVLRPTGHGSGLVGSKAPDFTLNTVAGTPVQLSALSGHPILLNFWGVNCGPCRRELPVLQQAYRQYRDSGLVVIGVDAQLDDAQAITTFASEHGASYQMLLNPSQALMQTYGLDALPRTYLIDRSGVVRADEQVPFEDLGTLDTALKAIL